MKRTVSLFLICIMLTSLFATGAAASGKTFSDIKSSEYCAAAAVKVSEEGIMTGYPDGTFKPKAGITRAEMAAIVCRLRTEEKTVAEAKEAFSDVPEKHWAKKYIDEAQMCGIIGGDGNGSFRPDSAVKYEEALKMILCALNLDGKVTSSTDWSRPYIEKAEKLGITKNILGKKGKNATRGDVAVMLYNTFSDKVSDEKVIAERRKIAEETMRFSTSVLWTPKEDILYTISSNVTPQEVEKPYLLKAGRVYNGIPYGYGGSTPTPFLNYATEVDENGVHVISGIAWEALSGSSTSSRLGNDCSSALVLAWGSIGATFTTATTQTVYMTDAYGFVKVGDYTVTASDTVKYKDTRKTILENGEKKIFAAYASLQSADGVVRATTSGNHAMMVVGIDIAYRANGEIDEDKSTVTLVDQTAGQFTSEAKYYDEKLGCDVYNIGYIDHQYSFRKLIAAGYVPITCKPLVDPTPLAKAQITDSETNHSYANILIGQLESNWLMDVLTMTISDEKGNVVQEAIAPAHRRDDIYVKFDVSYFATEGEKKIFGKVDPKQLSPGKYNCKLVCRLVSGEEITVRDFDFVR